MSEQRLPDLFDVCESATRPVPVMGIGTQCLISNVQIVTDVYCAFEGHRESELVKHAVAVQQEDEPLLENHREVADRLRGLRSEKSLASRQVRRVRHIGLREYRRILAEYAPVSQNTTVAHDDQTNDRLQRVSGL